MGWVCSPITKPGVPLGRRGSTRGLLCRTPRKLHRSSKKIFCVMRRGKPSSWAVAVIGENSCAERDAAGNVFASQEGLLPPEFRRTAPVRRRVSCTQAGAGGSCCPRTFPFCTLYKLSYVRTGELCLLFRNEGYPYASRDEESMAELLSIFLARKGEDIHVPATIPKDSGSLPAVEPTTSMYSSPVAVCSLCLPYCVPPYLLVPCHPHAIIQRQCSHKFSEQHYFRVRCLRPYETPMITRV